MNRSDYYRKNKRRDDNTRRSKREYLVRLLGGKCSICGYDRCIEALDFHHKDAPGKKFSISANLTRSLESLQEEVLTCVLICANCHREEHYRQRMLKNDLPVSPFEAKRKLHRMDPYWKRKNKPAA